jgi:uncharacterized protein (TIGR00375 family)
MPYFDADLHIHSPYSIAVSQSLNLDTMAETAAKKGLSILTTGDITQPQWRSYLKENLQYQDGIYSYKNLNFIIGTELEDDDSVHHVVLLPDISAAERLQETLTPFVKDISNRWAGRPHVHKSPAEVVELIEDVGGICGPAHAFTPFKSIFRQGRYATLEEAYGDAAKKVPFIELGLSADTYLADRIESLKEITYLSNSDAHSQGPQSLGREFNRFDINYPTFDEIRKAIERREGHSIVLNVGLEPKLGKYNIMFCKECRRRVIRSIDTNSNSSTPFGFGKMTFNENFINCSFNSSQQEHDFLNQVEQGKIECPACKNDIQKSQDPKKAKKKTFPKLNLGVSERINQIATWDEPHLPAHRPPYLDIVPLIDVVRKIHNINSKTSKSLLKKYDELISTYGTEFYILADIPVENLTEYHNGYLSQIIQAFRNHSIKFIPGGGGTFGEIQLDEFDD